MKPADVGSVTLLLWDFSKVWSRQSAWRWFGRWDGDSVPVIGALPFSHMPWIAMIFWRVSNPHDMSGAVASEPALSGDSHELIIEGLRSTASSLRIASLRGPFAILLWTPLSFHGVAQYLKLAQHQQPANLRYLPIVCHLRSQINFQRSAKENFPLNWNSSSPMLSIFCVLFLFFSVHFLFFFIILLCDFLFFLFFLCPFLSLLVLVCSFSSFASFVLFVLFSFVYCRYVLFLSFFGSFLPFFDVFGYILVLFALYCSFLFSYVPLFCFLFCIVLFLFSFVPFCCFCSVLFFVLLSLFVFFSFLFGLFSFFSVPFRPFLFDRKCDVSAVVARWSL